LIEVKDELKITIQKMDEEKLVVSDEKSSLEASCCIERALCIIDVLIIEHVHMYS